MQRCGRAVRCRRKQMVEMFCWFGALLVLWTGCACQVGSWGGGGEGEKEGIEILET